MQKDTNTMYNKNKHLHFIGIGGIGMSGIATILRSQGYTISGCDSNLEQKSVRNLQKLGCRISKGNNTSSCHDNSINIVVFSSAIADSNPELAAARKRGIPTISRAIMLAELMRTKYSIAIGGSHGKTTTTSLISHILIEAEYDPTVIIGGHLKTISNNARLGSGDFLVAEADESDRSIVHLQATIAVLTNIDFEHVDTYTNLEDVKKTFKTFLNNLPFYGTAIVCSDDENVRSLLPLAHKKIITYGLHKPAEVQAQDIELHPEHSIFTLVQAHTKNQTPINLNMPGKHNILNSLAAITVAQELGVSLNSIQKALKSFLGVERRFSYRGAYKSAEIFDDYGHHPIEIENTLLVAKKRCKGRLVVVFQPHRYTRTKELWNDFVTTLCTAEIDHLIITDIYAASEQPIDQISSEHLVHTLQERNPALDTTYTPFDPEFIALQKKLEQTTQKDDLILLLGAGSITRLAGKLLP